MVLNAPNEEKRNEKTEWQLQKAVLLPSMRTQPPTGTYPHDTTSSYDRCFGLLDCLGLASNDMSRPHEKNQPSAPFTGFQPLNDDTTYGKGQHLPTVEENREGYVMNPSFPQEVKLPPISSLDWNYRGSNHKSWNRTVSSRIQLDAVRLNPKRSPRRTTSTSPIVNRHTHRSPSHGGIQPSPKFPRLLYTRPQLEDDAVHVVDTEYDAPPRSSCNRPYNRAQIDWIRYFKVDLSISYDSMDKPFAVQWPGESKTGHCFSARLYRDNWMPCVDAANNPMYDEKGRVKMEAAKMREMKTQEGKEKCIPYSLVDRYPWRAVEYQWITVEDKERARAILSGDDPSDPTGRTAKWREVLWKMEDFKYRDFI